jgi:molybdopterin-guanine dinucleotide biosynthesis protein A
VRRARPVALTGILLAGGDSSRMGVDKATLAVDGERLAARVARRLAEVCDEVLVASGDGDRLGWLGLPQVADVRPGVGPLGGLIAGLEAASNDLVAVVAVDMPFASGRVLKLAAEAVGGHDAAVPVTDGGPEPLHAIYARRAAEPLRRCLASGTLGVRPALGVLSVVYLGREAWGRIDASGAFAANVNAPEDLSSLRGSAPAS